ncbi:MAG: LPS export ABC transporter periplasmic protein LptC [Gemmatimonadales bacterium]
MTARWLGALAGLVVGLAACSEQGVRPTQNTSVADSADQIMFDMTTNMLDDGIRTGYVTAETTYVYQASQKMDLRRFKVTFFENGKQSSVITAEQGYYTVTTGGLDARGNVKVESTDGRVLTTPHLIYDKSGYQIRSDTAFVYNSRDERMTGTSFTSDLEFRNVRISQPRGFQRRGGIELGGSER